MNGVKQFKEKYSFEYNSAIVFLLSMISNLLTYAFQLAMGRLLPVDNYGKFGTILSTLMVSTIPVNILAIAVSKYITEAITNNDKECELIAIKFGQIMTGIVSGITVFVCFLIINIQVNYEIFFMVAIALSTIFLNYNILELYVLQGRQNFGEQGILNIIVYFIRLLLGVCVVYFIPNEKYLIFVLDIAWICSIIYALTIDKENRRKLFYIKVDVKKELNEWWNYLYELMISHIGLQLLLNIDIILVKLFCDDEACGFYVAANTIARTAMYVTNAIVTVMLPKIIENRISRKENKKILLKTIMYSIGSATFLAFFIYIFSDYIMLIMYGEKYIESSHIMKDMSVYIISLAFLNILVYYSIGNNSMRKIGGIIIISVLIEILGVYMFHTSIYEIINVITITIVITDVVAVFKLQIK